METGENNNGNERCIISNDSSWFSQFRNASNPWMARYAYAFIFLLANLLAWAARDYGRSALTEMESKFRTLTFHYHISFRPVMLLVVRSRTYYGQSFYLTNKLCVPLSSNISCCFIWIWCHWFKLNLIINSTYRIKRMQWWKRLFGCWRCFACELGLLCIIFSYIHEINN